MKSKHSLSTNLCVLLLLSILVLMLVIPDKKEVFKGGLAQRSEKPEARLVAQSNPVNKTTTISRSILRN